MRQARFTLCLAPGPIHSGNSLPLRRTHTVTVPYVETRAVVDSTGRTSASGMWVAGDAVDPRAPMISAARAGATAAIAINADLVGGRHRERGRGGGMSTTWLVQPRATGENRGRVVVKAAQSS